MHRQPRIVPFSLHHAAPSGFTMATVTPPKPPTGLDAAGRNLWAAILGELPEGWEFSGRELDTLARAARCADELSRLEAVVDAEGVTVRGSRNQTVVHPAIPEGRQMRLTMLRLLAGIDRVADGAPVRDTSLRARSAARKRWDPKKAVR